MEKQQLREITAKIVLFVKALGMLISKVAKQLVLPNRKRKGNLLSSLLLFFIYLNDLFITFSRGFSIKFILRWKHYDRAILLAKQAMLFTACVLFLISSFEWSYPELSEPTYSSSVIQSGLEIDHKTSERTVQYHALLLKKNVTAWDRNYIIAGLTNCGLVPRITSRIYLHNCNFRI
jgi:hypothetical protein